MGEGEWSHKKRPFESGFPAKKQMKSPFQVRILEEVYQVFPNPSTRMKEELARRTGLDYMQVQYWFGNRRFFDKHGPRRSKPRIVRNDSLRGVKSAQVASEFNPDRNSDMPLFTNVRAGPSLTGSIWTGATTIALRRNDSSQTFMHAGPSMLQPEMGLVVPVPPQMTQSYLLPLPKLQQMVMHVEDKLGHPLRADGPILGTEFKPLPPGAFGTPIGNVILAIILRKNKYALLIYEVRLAATFLPRLEHGSVVSSLDKTGSTVQYIHSHVAEAPRVVHEYQLFPTHPSWMQKYENVNQTHFPMSSVKISNKHAYDTSCFPLQFGRLDAIHQSQQGRVQIISPLGEHWNVPNLVPEDYSPADGHAVNPVTKLDNLVYSSDNAMLDDDSSHKMEKTQVHPPESPIGSVNETQQFDLARFSAQASFEEVNNEKCYQTIQGIRKKDQPYKHRHWRGYDRYILVPHKRSENASADAQEMRDFDDSCRPLIAKWNRKENQAVVYVADNTEDSASTSSEIGSTSSYGYDDEPIKNVKGIADGN
ncbi:hypothetical protein Cni_G18088 [Canna indica]|uniref:Homeobox domain-containing protein n=1 Tax=Canna indica TaxID=4628 RepID=A0AAQ3KK62_9LILI|nr:hypothetical protein Cni_G18088 [Canna indica]